MALQIGTTSKARCRNPMPLLPTSAISAAFDIYRWHDGELKSIIASLSDDDYVAVATAATPPPTIEELQEELASKDAIIAAQWLDLETQATTITQLRQNVEYFSSQGAAPAIPSHRATTPLIQLQPQRPLTQSTPISSASTRT